MSLELKIKNWKQLSNEENEFNTWHFNNIKGNKIKSLI